MNTFKTQLKTTPAALIISACALLASGVAYADKPNWAGNGQGKSEQHGHKKEHGKKQAKEENQDHEHYQQGDTQRSLDGYFTSQHISLVRDFYQEDVRKHGCPKGLAKKNNGCMPPGQAKKWRKGQALARDVVYVDVPRSVITIVGAAPAGHRYVRVANDLLLIAIGTSMVVDAIEDILR